MKIKKSKITTIIFYQKEILNMNTVLLSSKTLGNHEFDDGVGNLLSYLNETKSIPTVVSNLNTTAEPDLNEFLLPSLTFTLNGTKVGIVGYLTPKTAVIICFFLVIFH